MGLIANKGKPIFPPETNVNLRQNSSFPTDAAYDLALYEEVGHPDRAVLVVTIILVFDFKDTTSLSWTATEKTDFMTDFTTACTKTWGEIFQLTTVNPTPPAKVAGVVFDIQTRDGGSGHSHWNVLCRKVASLRQSKTYPGGGGTFSNGEAEWDSLDLTPATKKGATTTQRAALHEFGHMLGYRDEYPLDPTAIPLDDPNVFTTAHSTDRDSIMFWGETLYPRHYVFFADWISSQWIKKDSKNCKGHDWKVSGTIDTTTAGL